MKQVSVWLALLESVILPETVFGFREHTDPVIPGPLPQDPPVDNWRDNFDFPWAEGFEDEIVNGFVEFFDYPGVKHVRGAGEKIWSYELPKGGNEHPDYDPKPGTIAATPLDLLADGMNLLEGSPIGHWAQFDKYAAGADTLSTVVEQPEFGGALAVGIVGMFGLKGIGKAAGKAGKTADKVGDMRRTPQQKQRNAENRTARENMKRIDETGKKMFPPSKAEQLAKGAFAQTLKFITVTGPAWAAGWVGLINQQIQGTGTGTGAGTGQEETLSDHLQRIINEDGLKGLENVKREIEGLQDTLESHPANQPGEEISDEAIEIAKEQVKAAAGDMAAWIKEKVQNGKYIELMYGNELNFIRRVNNAG